MRVNRLNPQWTNTNHFFYTIVGDGRNRCGIHRTLMLCKLKISMLCWDASSMHRYLGPVYPNENLREFAWIWVTRFTCVCSCCMGYIPEYCVCLLIQECLIICDLATTDQNQDRILKLENHLSHIHYELYFLTQRS